jgi:hypothetical protein
MKKIMLLSFAVIICFASAGQFVARMEVKDTDTLTGVCDRKNVYTLFPMFQGQEEAVCSVYKDEMEEKLNTEVSWLKDNPKQTDKGMVSIIISCKGEVVRCETDNKTKSEELDKQILAVFPALKTWKPGKLNGKEVDSLTLWSFEIKKGKLKLN